MHDPREVFTALRWIVRAGAPWRYLPGDLPPWPAVSQQTQQWIAAGCFAAMVHDLRELLRWTEGRADDSTAIMLDSATRQSTPDSGARAGYDGHKKRKGSKIHMVFLIQNTQNRDAWAMHLKLDELIHSIETVDDMNISAEDETDEELLNEHTALKARLVQSTASG